VRILHTSDWHLGRSFHRADMLVHQAGFVDHLVDVVRAEGVDVVVIAGDVYDRALPSVDTVALLDEAITRLRDAGAVVLLTSGNHDSAVRLGFGSRVLEQAGVHVRTRVSELARPVELQDEHGLVVLYGLPYLEPAMAADPLASEQRSHLGVLSAAMRLVRHDLAQRPPGTRSLVAAHAFVTGGQASDSERDISVGGVGSVPADVFDGVDYVALGHLHGRQRITETVRYSGSPLAYSFSEHRHTKGSWLVDLDASGVRRVEPIAAPVPRPLALLRGRLDELLADPAHDSAEHAWCQLTLTDPVRPRDAMVRLRQRFPHTLALSFEPDVGAARDDGYAARVRGRSGLDVCCGFLEHVRGGAGADESERLLLAAALEGARTDGTESAA
jgi:exonuclease SbcD